jgi:predicted MFS family arabinose efflux permease
MAAIPGSEADRKRKNRLLLLLLVVFAFNHVDRLALGLLLQNIKAELRLTDTQLGMLTGLAFAVFYSLMGVVLARWADRGNRVAIITVTTALWSILVALCGFAASFAQLILLRIGVAVGEAGCAPAGHSLIADHFDRTERSRAASVFMLGGPLSVLIGYFMAGWLNSYFGWRATFVILGLPGVAIAACFYLTVRDPRVGDKRVETAAPSLPTVARALWGNVTFCQLLFCYSVSSFFAFGIGLWQPAFFRRSFGLDTGELGTWLAVIWGIGGLIGTYLGGDIASRRAAGRENLQLRAMAAAFAAFGVLSFLTYLSSNQYFSFALLGVAAIGVSMVNGPLFGMIQSLVAEPMRATAIALLYLAANLVGMGLGPLAAGALSDALRPVVGEESLRYALLALCPGYFWAAGHLWRGSRTVLHDLDMKG